MEETYKLQLKDFIPYKGFKRYQSRKNLMSFKNQGAYGGKAAKREAFLWAYNFTLTSIPIIGLVKGIEALIR